MSRSPDAVVVGAGIVGAACARAFAREGLRVLVFERDFPAGGTTAAAMGHVVVMDDSPAQFALTAYSRKLWIDIAAQLPRSCEDDACGTLWIAADAEEQAHVRAKAEFYRQRGVAAEVLDTRELKEAEPQLRDGLAGALHVPDDRVVYPPHAARFLLEDACARGAEWRRDEVTTIDDRGVSAASGRIDAGIVVNAAGIAAVRLTPGLPIEPRKGHLVITERQPGFCRHELVELGYLKSAHTMSAASIAFNLQPRATGQLLIGSSREFVGLNASTNRDVLRRMLTRAISFLPRLAASTAVRSWVGFRPATPDKLPLVGRHTSGVWIAAGHEGLGITTALGTAALLADLAMGRKPAIDPTPFAPDRAIAHG